MNPRTDELCSMDIHDGKQTRPKARFRAAPRNDPEKVYGVCGVCMGRAWRRDERWIVTRIEP